MHPSNEITADVPSNGHIGPDVAYPSPWATSPGPLPAPRRLRGLRMPVLPSFNWLAQVGGGLAGIWGVYATWGIGAAAIVGGAAAVLVGALREAGKI